LSVFPLEERLGVALELSRDTTRAVRIGTAELIVEQDLDQLPPEQRAYAIRAREELEAQLLANADFPAGRLQAGDYYFRRNNVQRAVKEYEIALKMDSLLTPVYTNLATGYNLLGKNEQAIFALNKLTELEPEYSRGYYLRGLLHYEMGNAQLAISDLQVAVNLDPLNFRALLNLGNLYLQIGQIKEAELIIQQALALNPTSSEADQLLRLIREQKTINP
jgi:tetratricopeptide (TPR) repeat protein